MSDKEELKQVLLVRFTKSIANQTVEYSSKEITEDKIGEEIRDFFGDVIDGGTAFEMNGSRVAVVTGGVKMLEVWEKPASFDPKLDDGRLINGFTYMFKETAQT